MEQFPSLFLNGILCPVCEESQSQLQMYGWKDGSGGSCNELRKIHGICSVILLVSGVYKCKKGHETYRHAIQTFLLATQFQN